MRLNGFRCDVCCKEHLLDPTLIIQGIVDALPNDWFWLYQGKYEHSKEPLLFCSVDCLSQWAGKQVAFDREAKQSPEYKAALNAINEAKPWEDW